MKQFKVCPDKGKYIPDILPNGKRIEEPVVIPLNEREFLRCRSSAMIFALVGEPPIEVATTGLSYEEAMDLFNTEFPEQKSVEDDKEPVESKVEADQAEEGVQESLKEEDPTPVADQVENTPEEKDPVSEEPKQEESEEPDEVEEDETPVEVESEQKVEEKESEKTSGNFSNTKEHLSNGGNMNRVSSNNQNPYKGFDKTKNKKK